MRVSPLVSFLLMACFHLSAPQSAMADPICEPECEGKTCGEDGCGGICGTCVAGSECDDGVCVVDIPCAPSCDGMECGGDGCGGVCGECTDGWDCSDEGLCVDPDPCTPACEGKACGPDGCGASCGECSPDEECVAGACVTPPPPCEPDCEGKSCGEDGCGGICGSCDPGFECDEAHQCAEVPACDPDCAGKACGDDGCGGECGSCDDANVCTDDLCDGGTCTNEPAEGECEGFGACVEGECVYQGAGPCADGCDGPGRENCHCDASCAQFGDCCADACLACGHGCPGGGPADSCKERCGEQAPGGCWCDAKCHAYGDCCVDACEECDLCSDPLAGFEAVGACPEWLVDAPSDCCNGDEARTCVDGTLFVMDCANRELVCRNGEAGVACVSPDEGEASAACEELQAAWSATGDVPDGGRTTADASDGDSPEDDATLPSDTEARVDAVEPGDDGCHGSPVGGATLPAILLGLLGWLQRRRMVIR